MSSTFLEVFCDLLKGLPNDFARELANVQRLDRMVEDLKPRIEASQAAALNICHSNRKIEGHELTKLLQHLKTERECESEALRMTLEKIAIFDHTIMTINSYMDRLEEDIERYEESLDEASRHQAAIEEAKLEASYQSAGGYAYSRSQSYSGGGYGGSGSLARVASSGGGYGQYQGSYAGGSGYAGSTGAYTGAAAYASGQARRTSGVGTATTRPGVGAKDVEVVTHEEPRKQYCICGGGDSEDSMMIGCDSKKCEREWFHLECVGLKKAPQGAWYCDDCIRKGYNHKS